MATLRCDGVRRHCVTVVYGDTVRYDSVRRHCVAMVYGDTALRWCTATLRYDSVRRHCVMVVYGSVARLACYVIFSFLCRPIPVLQEREKEIRDDEAETEEKPEKEDGVDMDEGEKPKIEDVGSNEEEDG
ncbi:hypothetical protein scyTo_0008325 [Scyliorhinus torazame]|uniref:Uncharacterized protein n=1 Tax=Scyliorhinus torazame TaxID=75743 RepID=A0A401P7F8_SCYTO|nr:hypothetical protein [Scyliorhinus torazame]